MPTKRHATRTWLQRHRSDPFVRQARSEGYRSRAVYKLEEIDRRVRLLRPGLTVLDLGAAPGGWAQYAVRRVSPGGAVIAVDLRPLPAISGVTSVCGDITEDAVRRRVLGLCPESSVDLLLSDMAPDLSGIKDSDQARAAALAAIAVELALVLLRPSGKLLLKFFEGAESAALRQRCRVLFGTVRALKPEASRTGSSEQYLLCARLKKAAPGTT